MPKFGEIIRSQGKDVDPIINELSLMKQLIKERVHSLDLLRELLSNSGAKEVEAAEIRIKYTVDEEGHIFEIVDNGCGMDFSDNKMLPGRLDKFFGLGLSTIVGIKADEFSWKGLGSKLAYQSRRIEIDTCCKSGSAIKVEINEPWSSIDRKLIPKPKVFTYDPGTERKTGTSIKVVGHPPHTKEISFTADEIKKFLLHRTFMGFTRERQNAPKVTLSVLGRTEDLQFGFPEFHDIDFKSFEHSGLKFDESIKTLYINMKPKSSKQKPVVIKGFITWDTKRYDLSSDNLNTGLIISVKGIPYFKLDMEEYGVTSIRTARPGEKKTCLILECDWIQDEMNISRSGLVDSPKTVELRNIVAEMFQRIETSQEFLTFRSLPEKTKIEDQSEVLAQEKLQIESKDQNWVVFESGDSSNPPIILIREPKYEHEVDALIWKLEAMNALPFETFQSLAYIGGGKGPDLLVSFLEEKGSEPQRATVVEIELNFYNYRPHGHKPAQYPKVICWDVPSSGRKVKLNKTKKSYKYTANMDDYQVHVYCIKNMPGIKVYSRDELQEKGFPF